MLLKDLRYALGSMRRQPLLTITTVLTLALGIGLNLSIFTVVEGLLFRARVDQDPRSFVHLSPEFKFAQPDHGKPWSVSVRDYRAYMENAHSLTKLAAWDNVRVTLEANDGEPLLAMLVTCNFFSLYGLEHPARGRLFADAECARQGDAPVVLLSEEIWRDRFGSDPAILGKRISLNRLPFTVLGIIPRGFSGRLRGPGIWLPYTMQPVFYQGHSLFQENTRWLTVEGRLQPGHSRAQARSELAVLAARLDLLEPGRRTTMVLTNGSIAEEPSLRVALFWVGPLIMGALTLVLVIACLNVVVLQLSRSVSRRGEMAIRLSLGAGRARLVRTLLTEMVLLASLAGAFSLWLAFHAPALLMKWLGSSSMPMYQLQPDSVTLAYLCLLIFAAVCLAGLSPATESLRIDLTSSLKTGGTGLAAGSRGWQRNLLVATQVALCLTLLVGAALFIRARDRVLSDNPGFETRHVLAIQPRQTLERDLRPALEAIPGVQKVAYGSPFSGGELGGAVEVRLPGQVEGAGRSAEVSSVSRGFFEVLGIPLERGRDFLPSEEVNSRVAIVSSAFVRSFFADGDPLRKRLLLPDGTTLEVVGVVHDIKSEKFDEWDGPHLYRLRDPRIAADAMVLRFTGDARPIARHVRDFIAKVDPQALVFPKTLQATLDEVAARSSTLVGLVTALAVLAVMLAALGIYGVIAFSVGQRTKEFGIRMALGATRTRIIELVMITGAKPVLAGLSAGMFFACGGAMLTSRVLRYTPVALHYADPVPYGLAVVTLLLAAIAAMLRPAWRAGGASPVEALRDE